MPYGKMGPLELLKELFGATTTGIIKLCLAVASIAVTIVVAIYEWRKIRNFYQWGKRTHLRLREILKH